MYLTQYKEICEKQGWTFETCDNGKKVRITLTTLPSEHSFTVSKDSFAEQIKAVSESYLAKEYARIGHETSTTGKPISLAPIFNDGFAVSAALDALTAALSNAKVEAQTWICTDPDTCQWRRQIGETRFELYDILEVPDGYFAVHGEVDPAEDMTPGELEQLKSLVWRYFMSYWNNRRICSANGGLPPMVKRSRFYAAQAMAA